MCGIVIDDAGVVAMMGSTEVVAAGGDGDGDGKQADDDIAYAQEAHSVVVETGW